jgi:predicted amidophosphoribosyltransferase
MRAELATLLRPPACVACARPAAWPLCAACLPAEPSAPGPWRLAAGLPGGSRDPPSLVLWSLGPYRDGLRQAVLAGKLGGQSAALAALGRRLGLTLADAGLGADLVTWVASRPGRRQPRDHARVLAGAAAAALGLPAVRLLHPAPGPDLGRSRGAPAAGGRPGPRATGPPRPARALAGGRVLVVDDVATTGATLTGAAAVLLAAGARSVEAATLAVAAQALGGPHDGPPV